MKINIYTDGAAKGNPGPGGYGVVLMAGKHYKELSAGYRLTTNNRMELLAVIVGLEALKKLHQEVTVYSDSKYVVDAVEKGWVFNWEKKNFKEKKNQDLWKRFLKSFRVHQVHFKWIKGHAGHPQNEKCDQLAVAAAESRQLSVDVDYESTSKMD
tara:strand:+ start:115 stop:579 length:465 start_codon:yes stop_codon:yes gene_type:complete